MRVVLIVGAVGVLAACATTPDPNKLYVTLDSDPPGALLAERRPTGLSQLGMGPIHVTYTPTEQQKKDGFMVAYPVQATWKSGVMRVVNVKYDLTKSKQATYTFVRPDGGDVAMDRSFGFDLQAKRQAKKDADDETGGGWGAAVLQGLAAGVADYGNSRPVTYPAVTPTPRVTCVSKRNGLNPAEVRTVCE